MIKKGRSGDFIFRRISALGVGSARRPGVVNLGLRGYASVARNVERTPVTPLLVIVGWCLLFVLCWPLAILALVLWPFLWLLSLPFRVVAITFDATFALLRAVMFLPARICGYRGSSANRSS